jgi:hypothetical protein
LDDALAKNNGGNGSPGAPAAHHSSSTTTTTTTPHLSGVPRIYSGNMPRNYSTAGVPYRATVNYHNGYRTLNYPAVGVSNVNRSSHSSGNLQQASTLTPGGKSRLNPQTSTRLRHWNGNVSSTSQARLNHINNFHHHHDHHWWRNHCAAIIFFDFGWWGWYDGWWYPAWGYDPYSYYEYNEPIYGYNGLSPDQIVAGVQVALQQQGYYTYAIDGKMGPLTRAALARYQRDHLLPISSGIDPATLGSLGVIR